ncbi:MAG: glycerate kinase, partial [Syntrophomonadaceae bacterium]|nr:glycerate kinase [Syntrophomonadaceae bacterium]
ADLDVIDISGLDKRIALTRFKAACDVQNPLAGPQGATYVFGPQKGADEKTLALLDQHMAKYGKMVETLLGVNVTDLPGAGAAGGLGAAIFAFLGAELKSGIDLVMETVQLEKHLSGADLVFTGEGKIDSQTSFGKTLWGVARLAKGCRVPLIALTGKIGDGTEILYENGFSSIFAIADGPLTLEQSISQAAFLLESAAERIFRLIKVFK